MYNRECLFGVVVVEKEIFVKRRDDDSDVSEEPEMHIY